LGRFLGIDVFMHFTFLLLIGWLFRNSCRTGVVKDFLAQ
jgi:hypothetical protein